MATAGEVTIRPDANVNALWFINDVANINSITNEPTVYTATLIQAADGLSDNTTQKYSFADPSGESSNSKVLTVSLWVRGRRFAGDPPGTDAMDATIKVGSTTAAFQSVALPTANPGGWIETVFPGDWTLTEFDDCEVHLRANNITIDGSLIVYVVYLDITILLPSPVSGGNILATGGVDDGGLSALGGVDEGILLGAGGASSGL